MAAPLPKKADRCPYCNGRGQYQILRDVYVCGQRCPECDGSGLIRDGEKP